MTLSILLSTGKHAVCMICFCTELSPVIRSGISTSTQKREDAAKARVKPRLHLKKNGNLRLVGQRSHTLEIT